MKPYVGAVVIYSFHPGDKHARIEHLGAGLPPCPAIVLATDCADRVQIRTLGEFLTGCHVNVRHDPNGAPNTWRWPDEHAAAVAIEGAAMDIVKTRW